MSLNTELSKIWVEKDTTGPPLPVTAQLTVNSNMDDTFFKSRPDQETKPENDNEDGSQSGKDAGGASSQCSTPSRYSTQDQHSVDEVPGRKGGTLIHTAHPDRPVVDGMAAQGFFGAN